MACREGASKRTIIFTNTLEWTSPPPHKCCAVLTRMVRTLHGSSFRRLSNLKNPQKPSHLDLTDYRGSPCRPLVLPHKQGKKVCNPTAFRCYLAFNVATKFWSDYNLPKGERLTSSFVTFFHFKTISVPKEEYFISKSTRLLKTKEPLCRMFM